MGNGRGNCTIGKSTTPAAVDTVKVQKNKDIIGMIGRMKDFFRGQADPIRTPSEPRESCRGA